MRLQARTTVPGLVLVLLGAWAHAQIAHPATLPKARAAVQGVPAGKKRGGAGPQPLVGKKSRITGDLYDRLERGEGAPRPRRAVVRLGDTVRGRTGAGVLHRVAFDAPAGARLSLRVHCPDPAARPTAHLAVPGVGGLVPFRPVSPAGRTLSLDDYVARRSGRYEILVGIAGGATAPYVVTTNVRWPADFEQTVRLEGRRPTEVRIPGVAGRRMERIEVRAAAGEEVDLFAKLSDPSGRPIPTSERTWRSPRGERLSIQRVEMETTGDYVLRIMDRRGAGGEAKVRVVFRNPPTGSETHDL